MSFGPIPFHRLLANAKANTLRLPSRPMPVKIVEAEKGLGMSRSEALRFLSDSRSTLQLGTTDEDGSPIIHPVWYYLHARSGRFYVITLTSSKKARNIRRRRTVYFDVDDDRTPYKGVRGKATARLLPVGDASTEHAERVFERYLELKDPTARDYIDQVRRGESVVVEITPMYLVTWDYAKLQ